MTYDRTEFRVRSSDSRRPGLIGAALLLLALGSLRSPALAQQTAIAGNRIDEATELGASAPMAPDRPVRIKITMALRNKEELDKLLQAQQNPSSPSYHQWLTPDEFNDRFGPTADDLAKIEGWLTKGGFNVESASMSSRTGVATATASAVESSLGARIVTTPDGVDYTNLSDPMVPDSIAPLIGSISGLGNTVHSKADVRSRSEIVVRPEAQVGGTKAFGPKDLWTFYD